MMLLVKIFSFACSVFIVKSLPRHKKLDAVALVYCNIVKGKVWVHTSFTGFSSLFAFQNNFTWMLFLHFKAFVLP